MTRVNALLHRVLAETLERLCDKDERLGMITITDVSCDPDLRRAVVYVASLPKEAAEALEEQRRSLQATLGAQLRIKRVPLLSFVPDPAIAAGARIEEALRRARGANSTDESL
jgi:ribosome-binding factor A